MSTKPRIVWITPDYFIDCDFNPEILKTVLKYFAIDWILRLPSENARFAESDFDAFKSVQNLNISFMYSKNRQRDPRRILYYWKLYRQIKNNNPDIIYLNCVPDPYLMPFFWLLNKQKTIFCAHDGEVHKGFDFQLITSLVFKYSYRFAKNVCMFSESQAKLFRRNFGSSNIYVIPLALKSFGKSRATRSDNVIKFLSFGVINYSKNIELLIVAACNVYERGYTNFKVHIKGSCSNWDFYESKIRYPEIFETDIRKIPNSEIPDMFVESHYFVQPYRHVSQSGALKLAFNYNIPVLASNFPGFSDEVKEGINGYLFNIETSENLENLLIERLEKHDDEYLTLLNTMRSCTKKNYTDTAIANKYLKMFNSVYAANVE